MSKPTLICTVGLPRSGKSTWARCQEAPIVSSDAIRLSLYGQRYWAPGEKMVWATADLMVKSLFKAGHDIVILDATNTERWQRKQWISDEWETQYKRVGTSPIICMARAKDDDMLDLIPVIQDMFDKFEPLGDDEFSWTC